MAYAKPAPSGGYLTRLSPGDEQQFQQWVKQNNVPFDPSPQADYDMRGFYKGLKAGDPHARTGMNSNDGKLHYSDYWKTPYHKSFSAESQWATTGAPRWNEKDQLVLPSGQIVLDERDAQSSKDSGGALPPLPAGFTLDQPQVAQASIRPPVSGLDRANAGAAGFNQGVAGIAGLPIDTMQNIIDLGKALSGFLYSETTGKPVPNTLEVNSDRSGIIGSGDYFRKLMGSGAAIPRPDDTASRYLAAGGRGAASAMLGPSTGVPMVPSLVSNVAGSLSSQGAAEAGVGPAGQILAGMAGGAAANATRAVLAEGVKRSFRGGEEGRQKVAENIQAFEDAGDTPSVGQATQNRRMQSAESLMSRTPGSAGVMARRAEEQAANLGTGIERQANQLSPKASAEQAGRAIERGVRGEGGFVENFKAKQSQLYDELDQYVQPDSGVDVQNTTSALKALNASIPGAPNTSKFFQNAKMRGIEDALQKDLDNPTSAQESLNSAIAKLEALRASRNAATAEVQHFSAFEKQQNELANSWTPVPGQPRFPGRYSANAERAAEGAAAKNDAIGIAQARQSEVQALQSTLDDLQAAVEAAKGKLPYEAVKKLRTLVGNEMADGSIMSDVPRSKWKALYGALTEDLKGAADDAGPEASAAWNRANNYTRAGMRRLETIDHVVEKNGGPEAVFTAATSGTKEGATTLRAVMQSLPPEAQKTVSATVLRRLGRATPGRQNDLGEKFSTETFLTNWNSMSPQAKAVLFDRYGPQFRGNMDQIAKVASNLRDGSKVFQNPSGTGQATTQTATVVSFATSLATGNVGVAGSIAGGVAGANLMARLMTHPPFVKWLATTTKAPPQALPALAVQLAQNGNADEKEFARLLKESSQK